MKTILELDRFTRAYVEAALWSSTDDEGEPLDANFDLQDIDPATLDAMIADCIKFREIAAEPLKAMIGPRSWQASTQNVLDNSAGHDFWLTRCGHGAGFWDGDWPEPHATQLDNAAKSFGNVDLYVGDDGKIYAD